MTSHEAKLLHDSYFPLRLNGRGENGAGAQAMATAASRWSDAIQHQPVILDKPSWAPNTRRIIPPGRLSLDEVRISLRGGMPVIVAYAVSADHKRR